MEQAPEDWIIPRNRLFDPIVSPELFEKVQDKLKQEPGRHRRNPRSAALWLAGLVYCGNCGGLMHGVMVKSVSKTKTKKYGTYVCGTANKWTGPKAECSCKKYRVSQRIIENYLRGFLGETGPLAKNVALGLQQQKNLAIEGALNRATEAIESESFARRTAESVRQVVEKIVVTFEATGKKSPIGRVKFVSVISKGVCKGEDA